MSQNGKGRAPERGRNLPKFRKGWDYYERKRQERLKKELKKIPLKSTEDSWDHSDPRQW